MNDYSHPEFPISCGDPGCCTGIAGENVMRECNSPECAGKETHPARYHAYDDAVFNTSRMRGIEKLYDAFRDSLHEAILEFGDIPYPTEFEPDENGIDEYREWYTTQVILKLVNP